MFLRLMCNLNAADLGKGAAMSLSDVKVITPKRFGDDRGFFSETWNKARGKTFAIGFMSKTTQTRF